MKKFMFFIAAAVSLAAVGCSKDDAAPEQVQYVSELTLKFEGDTRVSGSHDATKGFSFEWGDGNIINIYEIGTANYLQYKYDAVSGTFKPDEDVDSDKMEVGNQYFAGCSNVIPYSSVEDGKTVIEMGMSWEIENIPLISDVFTADVAGTVATMHHLAGVVEIPVKLSNDANISKVDEFELSVAGNYLTCDGFTATPEAPYIKSITDNGSYTATSHKTDITLNKESSTSIFFVVLPGTYTNVELKYYYTKPGDVNTDATIELGAGKTLVVERGKITKLPEVEVKPYFPMGGGK